MKKEENRARQTVFIVDDNLTMLRSLSVFLEAAGLECRAFPSAKAFLSAYDPDRSGCLILDLQMPEISGLQLQEALLDRSCRLPVIVVSGNASVMDAVRTMKLGTFEFIEKPYAPDLLLQRVRDALSLDLRRLEESARVAALRKRFDLLTDRERQILGWVISGKPSKHIADRFGLNVSTVNNHRANIMRKLHAETSAELAKFALLVDPSLAFHCEK